MDNLRLAYSNARKGKRQRPDVLKFEQNLENNLSDLRRDLLAGALIPGAYRTFTIHEPKKRLISVAPFRDRVLHHAIIAVCEPVFDRYQIHDSYACRRGRGTYAALDQARECSRCNAWYLKLDVRKYFHSICHEQLKAVLARCFRESALLDLFGRLIDSQGGESGRGLPIGNLTSQFLANHYLAAADHFVKEKLRRRAYVRYMDDMVLWADSSERLVVLGSRLTDYIERQLGLTIKPWCLKPVADGLPFLGHLIRADGISLLAASKRRYCAKLSLACRRLADEDWGQEDFAAHVQALVAVTEYSGEAAFRRRTLVDLQAKGIIS